MHEAPSRRAPSEVCARDGSPGAIESERVVHYRAHPRRVVLATILMGNTVMKTGSFWPGSHDEEAVDQYTVPTPLPHPRVPQRSILCPSCRDAHIVTAGAPAAEVLRFAVFLGSVSQGRDRELARLGWCVLRLDAALVVSDLDAAVQRVGEVLGA